MKKVKDVREALEQFSEQMMQQSSEEVTKFHLSLE
jgi:hypothetical protein